MKKRNQKWTDRDDIFRVREQREHFSRQRALKVKRELRRLAYS
jgi:hypothetical protein